MDWAVVSLIVLYQNTTLKIREIPRVWKNRFTGECVDEVSE
jgi:hypothetical protein